MRHREANCQIERPYPIERAMVGVQALLAWLALSHVDQIVPSQEPSWVLIKLTDEVYEPRLF